MQIQVPVIDGSRRQREVEAAREMMIRQVAFELLKKNEDASQMTDTDLNELCLSLMRQAARMVDFMAMTVVPPRPQIVRSNS